MSDMILFVDDDANILQSYKRVLRKDFAVDVALGGHEALQMIAEKGPYAVVVSDMQMPGMDGVTLLAEIGRRSPETVRMMLTGMADLSVAMTAVNEGHVFRFMTKPCPPETMAKALTSGLAQFYLQSSEKELLQKTLAGTIKVLTEVLSIVKPGAFGRASRARRLAGEVAEALEVGTDWQLHVAAMLSQLGCVTLPEEIFQKGIRGEPMSPEEWQVFFNYAAVGHDLISNIPRLEQVASIIKYQQHRYDGSGPAPEPVHGESLPIASRILKAVLDFDTLVSNGQTPAAALTEIRGRDGWYDPRVVDALSGIVDAETELEAKTVSPRELTTDMVFDADIVSNSGIPLATKGQEVTPTLRVRLINIQKNGGLAGPLQVRAPAPVASGR